MGKKFKLTLLSLSAVAFLAACGDTTTTEDPVTDDPVTEEPTDPVEEGMDETEDNTDEMDEETP